MDRGPADSAGNLVADSLSRSPVLHLDVSSFPAAPVKVADWLVGELAAHGVRHIFGVCGGGNIFLSDAIARSPITFVAMHHEQAAGMAAEGYARATGKLGVCLVTSGPGGTNAITALAGCWLDHVPVLFLSGQSFTRQMIDESGCRQIGVQEIDILNGVRPWTKYDEYIAASTCDYVLKEAVTLAFKDRAGPVWLDAPADQQTAEVSCSA